MQKCGIVAVMVALLTIPALTTADAKAEDQYLKVEIKGTLKTGIVAPGGETTGIVITFKPQGAEKEVTWELDLGENADFKKLAEKLNGKTALVTGTYTEKKGTEVRLRHIVKVTSLKEPDAK